MRERISNVVAFENFMFYACFIHICVFSDFSTNKQTFLFLIIVGSKCVAISKKMSDHQELYPMDPIDRSDYLTAL